MDERELQANGVRLCAQAFGDPEHPLVLLIMGLGLDLLWWRKDFCRSLAARGLRVVRFDNRDAGRSTAFRGPGVSSGRVTVRGRLEFLRPPSGDPAEALVATFRRIGSHGRTEADDEDVRALVAASARRERGDGSGPGRQLAAILTERDRTADLWRLEIPALVIHGDRDHVIAPSGGRATAAAIPGAELLELEGMGHDLARRLWPEVLDGIQRIVDRA